MALRMRASVSSLPKKAEINVEHARSLALAHQGKAEGVHHVTQLIALVGHPLHDNRLLALDGEIIDALQHAHQLGHLLGGVLLPTLFHRLLVIAGGRQEEERAERPQLLDEVDTVFHHVDHLRDALHGLVYAVVGRRIYSWLNQMPFL